MVFVKVRETYDLHTVQNKMTVIGIHTPKADIIKRNYPGLLLQCRAYRPYSCDVRIACASVLPLDPRGVGTSEDDVAPEDIFNPILYKAMSNKGMSQLEARINALHHSPVGVDVQGSQAFADVDTFSASADDFNCYYGLLSDTHSWKHASPQAGLSMSKLKPLVYEMVYNVGDSRGSVGTDAYRYENPDYPGFSTPLADGNKGNVPYQAIIGKAKEFPFLNCTSYNGVKDAITTDLGTTTGFPTESPLNAERVVPYLPVVVAGIIIPPSRLHTLYYRMVVEWTIEFTSIRSMVEITDFPGGIDWIGNLQHFANYGYSKVKEALTGTEESILDKDSCMVSANVDVKKVM